MRKGTIHAAPQRRDAENAADPGKFKHVEQFLPRLEILLHRGLPYITSAQREGLSKNSSNLQTNRIDFADIKGEGVKKTNYVDVIYGSPIRGSAIPSLIMNHF